MDSETDNVTGLSGAWQTRTVSWPHVESDTQTRDEKRSPYVETPSCDGRHLCALLSREGKNRSETLSVLHVLTIAPTWVIGCWVGSVLSSRLLGHVTRYYTPTPSSSMISSYVCSCNRIVATGCDGKQKHKTDQSGCRLV